MPEKQTFLVGGQKVSGQDVNFDAKSEPWAQYVLEDGTQVKVKLVMLNAARLDKYLPNGDPMYQFQFQQIVGTLVPDNLKQPKQ